MHLMRYYVTSNDLGREPERFLAEHVPFVALRDGEFLTNSL